MATLDIVVCVMKNASFCFCCCVGWKRARFTECFVPKTKPKEKERKTHKHSRHTQHTAQVATIVVSRVEKMHHQQQQQQEEYHQHHHYTEEEEEDYDDDESHHRSHRHHHEKQSVNFFRFLHPKSIDTPEEIAQYIEERRKRFPTRANIERKKQEEAHRRQRGEIVLRDSRARLIMNVMQQQQQQQRQQHSGPQQLNMKRHRNLLHGLLEGQVKREKVILLQMVRHLVNARFHVEPHRLEPHIASQLDRIETQYASRDHDHRRKLKHTASHQDNEEEEEEEENEDEEEDQEMVEVMEEESVGDGSDDNEDTGSDIGKDDVDDDVGAEVGITASSVASAGEEEVASTAGSNTS